MRLKSPSSPWPIASCSRMPGQPGPSTTSITPAGAGSAARLTAAMRSASRATACQWSVPISGARPCRPPPPAEPELAPAVLLDDDRDVEPHHRPRLGEPRALGAQDLDLLHRGGEARGDLHHARVEPAHVGVDLAQHLDLHRELGVVERVAVGVEPLVGRPRRRGEGAAAGADREPRGLGGAPAARPRRSRSNGRSRRSRRAPRAGRSPRRRRSSRSSAARRRRPATRRGGARGRARRRRRRRSPRAGRRARGSVDRRPLERAETGGVAAWSGLRGASPGAGNACDKPRLVLRVLIWFICPQLQQASPRAAPSGARGGERGRTDAMKIEPDRPRPRPCSRPSLATGGLRAAGGRAARTCR